MLFSRERVGSVTINAMAMEEAQLKLKDLPAAMAFERQHAYTDVQGRRHCFSQFVLNTLRLLERHEPSDTLVELIQRFTQYRFADLSARRAAMAALDDFVNDLQRTATAAPVRTQSGLHELPVTSLSGVGPKQASLLRSVGIETVEQLLYYFPRRYLDYQHRARITDLVEGEEVTILGTIHAVSAHNSPNKNICIVALSIYDGTAIAGASWFYGKASVAQLESYKRRYAKGTEVMISGKVRWDTYKNRPQFERPILEILSYADDETADSLHAGRIVPVYPLTEGLNLRFLRRVIHQALTSHLPAMHDPLPDELRSRYQWMPLQTALQQIHFPESMALAEDARRRLVFDELFYLQTRLALQRAHYKRSAKGLSLARKPGGAVDQLLAQLPFKLTGAQQRVFEDICADLAAPEPMYRMLQGDVGSGKTVVALLALLVAVENGYQGALMVPTEILAEQHYRRFVEWLTPLGLRAGLFLGKTGAKERKRLRQDLENGLIHVAVGTHALIQDDVQFERLGVVIVDEQHRFGVRQRTLLREKGENPEMLTMTATPIPRSLALTLHGDLDVSILDERPPGRTPIKTVMMPHKHEDRAYQLIREEVLRGRQAYVVFPLIEESESLSARAATTEAERLQTEIFPELRIGLLHGKQRPEERDRVMADFAGGHLQILVATTVVEVGVDVPNATVMIIQSADRFGLSQLHQLRGRVGRGLHQSYCVLMADSRSEDVLQRLGILCGTEDGFVIAEQDLALRGPGEFLGTRQSGLPDFVLADLVKDRAILDMAKEAALRCTEDPTYLPAHAELEAMVLQKTQEKMAVLASG